MFENMGPIYNQLQNGAAGAIQWRCHKIEALSTRWNSAKPAENLDTVQKWRDIEGFIHHAPKKWKIDLSNEHRKRVETEQFPC